MPSAFDLIGRNPALQEHWIRRLFAFLLDLVVVIVIGLLFAILWSIFAWVWWLSALFGGLLWFV